MLGPCWHLTPPGSTHLVPEAVQRHRRPPLQVPCDAARPQPIADPGARDVARVGRPVPRSPALLQPRLQPLLQLGAARRNEQSMGCSSAPFGPGGRGGGNTDLGQVKEEMPRGPHHRAATAQLAARSLPPKHGSDVTQSNGRLWAELESPAPLQLPFIPSSAPFRLPFPSSLLQLPIPFPFSSPSSLLQLPIPLPFGSPSAPPSSSLQLSLIPPSAPRSSHLQLPFIPPSTPHSSSLWLPFIPPLAPLPLPFIPPLAHLPLPFIPPSTPHSFSLQLPFIAPSAPLPLPFGSPSAPPSLRLSLIQLPIPLTFSSPSSLLQLLSPLPFGSPSSLL